MTDSSASDFLRSPLDERPDLDLPRVSRPFILARKPFFFTGSMCGTAPSDSRGESGPPRSFVWPSASRFVLTRLRAPAAFCLSLASAPIEMALSPMSAANVAPPENLRAAESARAWLSDRGFTARERGEVESVGDGVGRVFGRWEPSQICDVVPMPAVRARPPYIPAARPSALGSPPKTLLPTPLWVRRA